jgi:hypothetical protein
MNDSMLRKLAYQLLPQRVIALARSQKLFSRLTPAQKEILSINSRFCDIHQNERCFILATGPSIRHQNLVGLKGEICIAVSNFYLHPDFSAIQPAYYCLAPWHPPHGEVAYVNLVNEVLRAGLSTKVYLGLSDLDKTKNLYNQHQSRMFYLNLNQMETHCNNQQQLNITSNLLVPESVTIMAIQVAIYMGFREIYLLGVDHDAILNISKQFANAHFYEETQAILKTDVGEFKSSLISYLRLWDQYEYLNHVARRKGIQILNATHGGLLDVFERRCLQSVLDSSSLVGNSSSNQV